jgi:hypothetical protein
MTAKNGCELLFTDKIGMKRHKILLSLILTLLVPGCFTPAGQDYEDHQKGYPVLARKVDLSIEGWEFYWGLGEGNTGDPVNAFLKLYAMKGDQLEILLEPNDLAKLSGLEIKSSPQALRLLRLFTDGETYYRFSAPFWIECGKGAAKVERKKGTFVVTRHLMCPSLRSVWGEGLQEPLYAIEERLSATGHYQRRTNTFIGYRKFPDYAESGLR